MSAWMCCDAHFDALLTYAIVKGGVEFSDPRTNHTTITAENADAIGEIFKRENARSLTALYKGADDYGPYAFRPFPHLLTDVEAKKAIDCLEYQSCESDDYRTTLAYVILAAMDNWMAERCGRRHPRDTDKLAWETAPWGIDDDSFTAAEVARRAAREARFG